MSNIKFSILIPAYKVAFLKEAIDSILNQSYENFELIILDDCSPEGVASLVDLYDDKRLFFYSNKINCGAKNLVLNWNKCLNHSSGDYVICMGDDDVLSPNCLELYHKRICASPDINVFHMQTLLIDENNNIICAQESRPEWESAYSALYNKLKGRLQYIGDWLFKRETLIASGGFFNLPYAWFSDDITPLIVGGRGGIANINEFGFRYRVSSITISSNTNALGKLAACNQAFQWYSDFLNKECNDDRDNIYRSLSKAELPRVHKKIMEEILSGELRKSRFLNTIKWLVNKNNYTYLMIIRSLVRSFR